MPSRPTGRALAALAALVALAAALAAGAGEAKTLAVVTSSTDLAALAAEIGGDRVRARSFIPGHAEPELWHDEVFPSWFVRAGRADVLIRIGLSADPWLDTVIENAMNRRVAPGGPGYVDASEGIAVLEVPAGRVDRSLGEIHVQGNPHYLLDPGNARTVARGILRALVRAAPEDAEHFTARQRAFEARLDTALRRWDERGRSLRGKPLAAYHKTWSYLARRWGLEVVGYCEPKPGIEPSPADVAELARAMRRTGARLIVHEPVYSPRIPEAVAREVERLGGGRVAVLKLPAHVGGAPEAGDYFALFDYLLGKLLTALP